MALGFYFDMTSCIGCRTCQTACKDKNNLPIGTFIRHVHTYEVGKFPTADGYHWSASCNHCENPGCMAACAKGAIYKNEEGVVLVDKDLCDGCGACTMICPYSHPQIVDGKAVKCDTCIAFRQAGREPNCVEACIMRCLEFGDLDELRAKHADHEAVNELPCTPEAFYTQPNSLINPKQIALDADFREKMI